MTKSYKDRKDFVDHLEKKYIKKVQLQAFKRENDLLRRSLFSLRGRNVASFYQKATDLLEDNSYTLRFI